MNPIAFSCSAKDHTDQVLVELFVLLTRQPIILSTLNIEPELVPKLTGVKFILMKPDEIEASMKREGRVQYIAFGEFRVEGLKVIVTLLDENWSRGPRAFVSSRSFNYEYSQTKAKWTGKLIKSGMLIS